MRLAVATLLALAGCGGCSGSIVRDKRTYSTEVAWNEAMHRASARELLRLAPTQSSTVCTRMADLGLTLQTLAPHHAAMARYLGGVTEDDPGAAPTIPPTDSICGGAR